MTPSLLLALLACGETRSPPSPPSSPRSPHRRVLLLPRSTRSSSRSTRDFRKVTVSSAYASWDRATNINPQTEKAEADATAATMAYLSKVIPESRKYESATTLTDDQRRQLHLLKLAGPLPAPADATRRDRLAALQTELSSMYGKGAWCPPGQGRRQPRMPRSGRARRADRRREEVARRPAARLGALA